MRKGLITGLMLSLFGIVAAQSSGGMMSGGMMSGGMMSGGMMSGGAAPTGDFVDNGGARIYYEVHGEGEPLVLVHGYPLNSGLFRDNVGPLSEQYQVITLDLRGYGRSQTPDSEGSVGPTPQMGLRLWTPWALTRRLSAGCRWVDRLCLRCTAKRPSVFAR